MTTHTAHYCCLQLVIRASLDCLSGYWELPTNQRRARRHVTDDAGLLLVRVTAVMAARFTMTSLFAAVLPHAPPGRDVIALAVSSTLFCSRGSVTPCTYFLHLSLSSVILTDSSTGSPVHVLMLSIQAVRGLPRLRAPGIVPCIISFSSNSFVSSWCDHSMLASLL